MPFMLVLHYLESISKIFARSQKIKYLFVRLKKLFVHEDLNDGKLSEFCNLIFLENINFQNRFKTKIPTCTRKTLLH